MGVQLGFFHLSFCGLNRRFRRLISLYIVVQLALRNGALSSQWSISVDIHFGLAELCLSLCELGIRLIEQSLKRTRINFKKKLALADKRTFFVPFRDTVPPHPL